MTKEEVNEQRDRMSRAALELINRFKTNTILSDCIIVDVEDKKIFGIFLEGFLRRANLRFDKSEDLYLVNGIRIILYNNSDKDFPDFGGLVLFA